MPSIVFEPYGYGGKYIVYESPVVMPYKVLALVAILFAAILVGAFIASDKSCR